MKTKFEYLDLQITLRCNAACKNCIKFCGMQELTGLDYSHSDLTLDQVAQFAAEAAASGVKIDNLVVTGGEPVLHAEIEQIVCLLDRELVTNGVANRLLVNTNRVLELPAVVRPYAINFSLPRDNPEIHHAVFVHPDDLGGPRPTFAGCNHYRKWRVVRNYQGYSLCCAGDAYIRLFGLRHLVIDRFPESYDDFPLARMDDVCQHCPFGSTPPLERDVGRPVSEIYARQFARNRAA